MAQVFIINVMAYWHYTLKSFNISFLLAQVCIFNAMALYTEIIWHSTSSRTTPSVKRNITSSEWRSLKSTTLKWIIFGHRWAKLLLMKHIYKIEGMLLSKRRKIRGNRKRSVFKNHRNCSLRTATKGRLFINFNYSFSLNFNDRLRNRRTGFCLWQTLHPGGEQFLW